MLIYRCLKTSKADRYSQKQPNIDIIKPILLKKRAQKNIIFLDIMIN